LKQAELPEGIISNDIKCLNANGVMLALVDFGVIEQFVDGEHTDVHHGDSNHDGYPTHNTGDSNLLHGSGCDAGNHCISNSGTFSFGAGGDTE